MLCFINSLALALDLKTASIEVNVRVGSKHRQLHRVKRQISKQLIFSFLCLENQTGEFRESMLYQDGTSNDLRTKPLTSLGWWQQLCAESGLNTPRLQECRSGKLLLGQGEVIDCPEALLQDL